MVPLLPPIEVRASLAIVNFELAAESIVSEEVLAELPPKEKPWVEALADFEASAELPPKEIAGTPCSAFLSIAVEVEKLKPLLLSAPARFRFGSGASVVEAFSASCLRVELTETCCEVGITSLFVPKLNVGVWVKVAPGVDEVAKLPNNVAPLLISADGLGGAAFSTSLGDGAGAVPKLKGFDADDFRAAVVVADGDFDLSGAPNWNKLAAVALPDLVVADDSFVAGTPNWNPLDEPETLSESFVPEEGDFDFSGLPNWNPPDKLPPLDLDDVVADGDLTFAGAPN
mmetsp:Transcript_11048/g.26546  ORF Transcript_11048/g.26546 Transcript_11048/m.26546 type:complete len:286 (+) Transcript_11048:1389-2246(+)